MNNLLNLAMNMMQQGMNRDPRVANNPMASEFMDILKSGDQSRGEQLAQNICKSYGISKEQALKQARSFFHF